MFVTVSNSLDLWGLAPKIRVLNIVTLDEKLEDVLIADFTHLFSWNYVRSAFHCLAVGATGQSADTAQARLWI